jgi:thiosulfate/3-mercaptopyruvate sulfurtransferase
VKNAKLIQAHELFDALDEPSLRVLDATAFLRREIDGGPYVVESGRASYEEGHIPGALFADVPGALSDPDSPFRFTLPTAARFADEIELLGVGTESRVVVYAQESPMWATRLWWLLRYFGFDEVRVLDGGLPAWLASEFPTESGSGEAPRDEFIARARPELLATKDDVRRVVDEGATCLVNALPSKAFRGEGPGAYSRPGRIPGSVSLPSAQLLDPSSGRFLDPAELRQVFTEVLAIDKEPVIAYCGGGISATVDVFALSMLGRNDVKLYDGSLTEWSADPALPLVVD